MLAGRALTALCMAVAVAACAPTPQRPAPGPRIQQNGYSFAPLNEPGWQLAGRTTERVVLGKLGAHADETLVISAMLIRLPSFASGEAMAAYVKAAEERDSSPDRFRMLAHTVTPYPGLGAMCVRSYVVVEDHKPHRRSTLAGHMILEIATLSCAHPRHPSVGVHLTYSHRYYPGHQIPEFADKAERMFRTLEFVPVKASDD